VRRAAELLGDARHQQLEQPPLGLRAAAGEHADLDDRVGRAAIGRMDEIGGLEPDEALEALVCRQPQRCAKAGVHHVRQLGAHAGEMRSLAIDPDLRHTAELSAPSSRRRPAASRR